MIVGNHDAFYKNRADIHSLGLIQGHANVTIVDTLTEVEAFGKRLLFVPWNTEIPDEKYDIIFGHFEIQNFKMNNFKVCDHGLMASELLNKAPFVFSGHFHNRNTKSYDEGNIIYVGNTFQMDFSDVGNEKGYHILDLEDFSQREHVLDFFPNTVSPKFKKILLSNIKDYKKEDFENNTIKLIVDMDATEKEIEKVQASISKFKPFQFHTEYNTTSKSVDDVEEIDSIDLMESMEEFIGGLKMESEKQKRVEKLIKRLYEKNK